MASPADASASATTPTSPAASAAPDAALAAGTAREGRGVRREVAWSALAAATAVCLAVALVGAGLGACLAPAATSLLAQATQDASASPYDAEQLLDLACAARAYTVDPRGEGSYEALASAELEAAEAAASQGSASAACWEEGARAAALGAAGRPGTRAEAAVSLALCGSRYALDGNAIAHLDDCNRLIGGATPWLTAAALGAAAGIAALAANHQRRRLGAALVAAPALVLGAFAVLGAWGALDFNGLFAAFHGALFPQGNWAFPVDSLLIALYPLDFWTGMAALWLATTAAVAILSLSIGTHLLRRAPARRAASPKEA